MRIFRYLKLVWDLMDTPQEEFYDLFVLILYAARRTAYDYKHATDEIEKKEMRHYHRNIAEQWIQLFAPDRFKNYRHRLHLTIRELESDYEKSEKERMRLRELLIKHNIDPDSKS